jgi:hypothetical protein
MSTETLSLCAFAEPDFGDLGELWQRAHEYLQRKASAFWSTTRLLDEPATALWRALISVAPASPRSR